MQLNFLDFSQTKSLNRYTFVSIFVHYIFVFSATVSHKVGNVLIRYSDILHLGLHRIVSVINFSQFRTLLVVPSVPNRY